VHVSDAIYGGVAARAIAATLEARWKIFVCPTILNEIDVVIRSKFNRSPRFANATIQHLRDSAEVANESLSRHQVPGDANDTPILRAAIASSVDYLVTGDAKLLALNPTEGVRIIALGEYLRILQEHGFATD
jgi:putative PIN family toxin of toxin-antitoxin system